MQISALENEPKLHLFVLFHIDAFQLAQSHQIGPYENPQLLSLLFPLLSVPAVPLMLHSHPQFIHLGEIQQYEVNRVINVAGHFLPTSTEEHADQFIQDNEILG